MAREFGTSRSTIAQMELGNRKLQADDLGRLAKIHGCSATSLLVVPDDREHQPVDELQDDLRQNVPEFSDDPDSFEGLKEAIILSRELTELEKVLGLEGYPDAGLGRCSSGENRWNRSGFGSGTGRRRNACQINGGGQDERPHQPGGGPDRL